MKLEKPVRHAIQTLLSQIVDVNNNIRTVQDNKEMSEPDKVAMTNFANYHLMVLAILLHEFREQAYKYFPDAKPIIDWSESHYNLGLEKKTFTLCKCKDCQEEEKKKEEQLKKDQEILNN